MALLALSLSVHESVRAASARCSGPFLRTLAPAEARGLVKSPWTVFTLESLATPLLQEAAEVPLSTLVMLHAVTPFLCHAAHATLCASETVCANVVRICANELESPRDLLALDMLLHATNWPGMADAGRRLMRDMVRSKMAALQSCPEPKADEVVDVSVHAVQHGALVFPDLLWNVHCSRRVREDRLCKLNEILS